MANRWSIEGGRVAFETYGNNKVRIRYGKELQYHSTHLVKAGVADFEGRFFAVFETASGSMYRVAKDLMLEISVRSAQDLIQRFPILRSL